MPNVLARGLNLETLHVRLQYFDLNVRQPEHRAVILDELAHERSRTPESLGLFLDGGSLLGREAKGLREVVVPGRGFGHRTRSSTYCLPLLQFQVKLKKDYEEIHASEPDFPRRARVWRCLKLLAWGCAGITDRIAGIRS